MFGMEYLNKARLLFLFIQVYIMRLLADSSYCDRCLDAPASCREVSGTFAVTVMSKGYNPVVTVPVGACYLNVTEKQRSENYLALKSTRRGYIFNGMWVMDSPGIYHGAGTDFQYARADSACPGNCIYSKGPIREEVVVQLLYHSVSPGVDYSYKLPYHLKQINAYSDEDAKNLRGNHPTNAIQSSDASSSRQPGAERTSQSGRQGSAALTDSRSYYSTSQIQSDVTHMKESRRREDRRQGYRRHHPIFSTDFWRPRTRQEVRQSLNRRRNRDHRQSLRERTYSLNVEDYKRPEISARLDPTANVLSTDGESDETRETNEVNIQGEQAHVWRTTGYSPCSRTCGGGIKQPILECLEVKTESPVTESFCQGQIKPELNSTVCNEDPCLPDWELSQWSTCSKSCGQGIQTRLVPCLQRISPSNILNLTEDQCLKEKPATTRPCLLPCYSWQTSAWSDCSVLCGSGVRNRHAYCQDETGQTVNDSYCSQSQPRTSRSCDLGSCTRNWYFSSWSNLCSEDCGSGHMIRKVHCITDSGRPLPDEECDISEKPEDEKVCSQNIPCTGQWFTGPWSKCSVSCGEGRRQRPVLCIQKTSDRSYHILDQSQCTENNKPVSEETCEQEDCETMWYMTDWSECSVSCGGGIKHRHIQCLDREMKHSTHCTEREKPADMTSCNEERCWIRPQSNNNGCVDRYPNCAVVVQTRLCRYPYYQRNCCRSCSGWP